MNQYQVVPWAHLEATSPGLVLEQYVPPELEALAREVAEQYDMQVSQMTLVTSKPDKGGAIWRIETNKGPRSLKVLHRTPQRSLYSVGAQEYLVNKGARVPALIRTKSDALYVEAGGKLWIVTDWIEPLTPVSKVDLEGAATLIYGLGEFHKMSQGYVPPYGSGTSTRLYGWPNYYQKIIEKIGWFRDIANAYSEIPSSSRLLEVVDEFERQARDIYARFLASDYEKMISKGEPHWGLAHQDYGWSNGQLGPGGIWVIDLDGVAYDLPIRDLRKLITSTMDDMGVWDITWIRGMIDAYHQANPIDRETFDLLWLDMAFPNEFYKHIKEIVFNPTTFMSLEMDGVLTRVLATESTKWAALAELEQDRMNYESGNYTFENTPAAWLADPQKFAGATFNGDYVPPASFETQRPAEPVRQTTGPRRLRKRRRVVRRIVRRKLRRIPRKVIRGKKGLRRRWVRFRPRKRLNGTVRRPLRKKVNTVRKRVNTVRKKVSPVRNRVRTVKKSVRALRKSVPLLGNNQRLRRTVNNRRRSAV